MSVVFKTVVGSLMLLGLVACKKQEQAPSPIRDIVKQFEVDRRAGINAYGLSTITSGNQSVAGVDCLVFNEAAKGTLPNTLGGMSALSDAMYYRMALGCEKTQQALTDYETTRRVLNTLWNNQLQNMPYTSQMLLKDSPLGKLVTTRIDTIVTEQSVCVSVKGLEAHQGQSSKTLRQIGVNCARTSAGYNVQSQCTNARMVALVHGGASGTRDNAAWMSELASRWRAAFNVCTNTSVQEFVQFHNTVPRELFKGPAYRFSIPVDPVMQCSIQQVMNKRARNFSTKPDREWVDCATKLYKDFGRAYITDQAPKIFSKQALDGVDSSQWIYNPEAASRNPQLWNFGECEKNLAAQMARNGLNVLSPQALKNHCSRVSKEQARQNL